MRGQRTQLLATLLGLLAISTPTLASQWTFLKIADTSEVIPGTAMTFTSFGTPALADGVVILRGSVDILPSFEGIYAGTGGPLSIIADSATAIPDGSGDFVTFGSGDGDSSGLAFLGFGQNPGQEGIYAFDSALAAVADIDTAIPGGTGNFLGFLGVPSVSGGEISFTGFGSLQQRGVYVDDGLSLSVIADTNTLIPEGSGNFDDFLSGPALHEGAIALIGHGPAGQAGIYVTDGALTKVADTSTPIPQGGGTFVDFLGLDMDSTRIVFHGVRPGEVGIYESSNDQLGVVADTSTAIPGGSGSFTGFGSNPSASNGVVAVTGSGDGNQSGIYSTHGGGLDVVLDRSMQLEGKSINFLGMASDSLEGGDIALLVRFTDESQAIYLAVPEPSEVLLSVSALLAVGGLGARVGRRSRTATS